jgi:predicted PolB exonuclease-like 3'-5' exonuclease
MVLAVDIETIPNIDMIDCLPEVEPAKNLKDPEKIKSDCEAKKQKLIDDMALSPFYGRICSAAIWGDDLKNYHTIESISDSEEMYLLDWLFGCIKGTTTEKHQILTWNGYSFDLPFIFKRAMILKMDIREVGNLKYWNQRYQGFPHTDVMREFCQWNPSEHLSLDMAAKCMLGEPKAEHDFRKFTEYILTGNQEKIGIYNLKDAELTYMIYKLMEGYLL